MDDGETIVLRPPVGSEGIHLLEIESFDKNSAKFRQVEDRYDKDH